LNSKCEVFPVMSFPSCCLQHVCLRNWSTSILCAFSTTPRSSEVPKKTQETLCVRLLPASWNDVLQRSSHSCYVFPSRCVRGMCWQKHDPFAKCENLESEFCEMFQKPYNLSHEKTGECPKCSYQWLYLSREYDSYTLRMMELLALSNRHAHYICFSEVGDGPG
jgi:hypothetical protein